MSFTFNDFTMLNENLKQFRSTDSLTTETTLFDNIVEVGIIYEGKNQAILLNSLDVIATKDALLNDQDLVETYRQIDIYSFSEAGLFSNTFSPLITFNQANYYANVNAFFVFTNTKEALENIIANYQNKTTYSEKEYYQSTKEHLTNASSLLMVANPTALKNIINNNFEETLNLELDDYKASALQFVYDTNFAHVNTVIKKNKTRSRERIR